MENKLHAIELHLFLWVKPAKTVWISSRPRAMLVVKDPHHPVYRALAFSESLTRLRCTRTNECWFPHAFLHAGFSHTEVSPRLTRRVMDSQQILQKIRYPRDLFVCDLFVV